MNFLSFMCRTTLILLPILALSLAGAAACGESASSAPQIGEMQIRGRVLEVVARNIIEVETLRLLGEDDQEYRLAALVAALPGRGVAPDSYALGHESGGDR